VLAGHPQVDLVAVVTSPEHMKCSYFVHDRIQVDVAAEANALGVGVLRPARVGAPEVMEALVPLDPDYFIVGNFQQRLGAELLAVPRVAAINFHPAPLPRYAGLAPFYWIVRNGERRTAISAIKMDEGLDTGHLILQRDLLLTGRETALELRTRQEQENVLMLLDLIPRLANGSFTCAPQDLSQRSYFGRPFESDFLLDFNQDARTIQRHVRAGYRHPGAYFHLPDQTKVIVLSTTGVDPRRLREPRIPGELARLGEQLFVAAANGWLEILSLEIEGKETAAATAPFFPAVASAFEAAPTVPAYQTQGPYPPRLLANLGAA
jgi:methionyl-tRNA formyltransferase